MRKGWFDWIHWHFVTVCGRLFLSFFYLGFELGYTMASPMPLSSGRLSLATFTTQPSASSTSSSALARLSGFDTMALCSTAWRAW